MHKVVFGVISFALCIILLALVAAEKPSEAGMNVSGKDVAKNMTYGQCVSEHAALKNTCYATVKEARASCVANATETAPCKQAYKKDLKQCKVDFKAAKQDCKKIKHSFFETTRYAFA